MRSETKFYDAERLLLHKSELPFCSMVNLQLSAPRERISTQQAKKWRKKLDDTKSWLRRKSVNHKKDSCNRMNLTLLTNARSRVTNG